MHAVTFLTAVSTPSFTTILEHISAVHPLLLAMSFFPSDSHYETCSEIQQCKASILADPA